MSMDTIERLESEVRSYCRSWPTVFAKASGSHLRDVDGREYIDFFAGAGALNYGHNEQNMKRALIDYIAGDNVIHGLDMATQAKQTFLERFDEIILQPRRMSYKIQFPGPTGTNAVEASLKLARKITGRHLVIGFTNAFHGMTLGSLSVTGNEMKRRGAGVYLNNSAAMPYEGFLGEDVDTIEYLAAYLHAAGSGVDAPAAVIVETVQAEGGMNTASFEWLLQLSELCRAYDMLLIVDDIQAGCGRTGSFFSFEPAGIAPDIICLSKSLSGIGLPLAITLMKPELDAWGPGEHNGTFRGNNAAFITASVALEQYWRTVELTQEVQRKSEIIRSCLTNLAAEFPATQGEVRGRGLLQGLFCYPTELAGEVCKAAFERGLIIETSGPESDVIKLLPPLTIDDDTLSTGLDILGESLATTLCAREPEPGLVVTGL